MSNNQDLRLFAQAIELVDSELAQSLPSSARLVFKFSPVTSIVQELKMFSDDYQKAKSLTQYSDAYEIHEIFYEKYDRWLEASIRAYNIPKPVLMAKVNVKQAEIKKAERTTKIIKITLIIAAITCAVWGFIPIFNPDKAVVQRIAEIKQELAQIDKAANKRIFGKLNPGWRSQYAERYDQLEDELQSLESQSSGQVVFGFFGLLLFGGLSIAPSVIRYYLEANRNLGYKL